MHLNPVIPSNFLKFLIPPNPPNACEGVQMGFPQNPSNPLESPQMVDFFWQQLCNIFFQHITLWWGWQKEEQARHKGTSGVEIFSVRVSKLLYSIAERTRSNVWTNFSPSVLKQIIKVISFPHFEGQSTLWCRYHSLYSLSAWFHFPMCNFWNLDSAITFLSTSTNAPPPHCHGTHHCHRTPSVPRAGMEGYSCAVHIIAHNRIFFSILTKRNPIFFFGPIKLCGRHNESHISVLFEIISPPHFAAFEGIFFPHAFAFPPSLSTYFSSSGFLCAKCDHKNLHWRGKSFLLQKLFPQEDQF